MFKKLIAIAAMVLATFTTAPAFAQYRMIVPQQVGGGTDVWARIVAKELEKKLGEKIIIENIPGINDIPGFNKFHNELRRDPKVIMVAHGGNAESFLLHKVDYNYAYYSPIGLQNLNIVVGRRIDSDPYSKVKFAAGSGMNPDLMAITMLVCGPKPNMQAYLACYNDKIVYVPGMKGNERRLAYMRGELNVTRETPAAYMKHPEKMAENIVWFTHGIFDYNTGRVLNDPNYTGFNFQEVYKRKWGVYPSGELYDAYLLVRSYRDVLQKSLWVGKNNPNRTKLVNALRAMTRDPVSMAEIREDSGNYGWVIGDDVYKSMIGLRRLTRQEPLKDLVWWTENAFKQDAYFKQELVFKGK